MARIEVVMPQMGESITTGTITKWHKQPGEVIELDAILLEISTDKVESEIPSPVEGKIVQLLFPVLNNGCHGMVRQFQESYFSGRYQSTLWGYSTPSFVEIAKAYGIAAASVSNCNEVEAALTIMSHDPQCPYLLEVFIDTMTNVYPKLAFGRPFGEMEPLSKPLEMEGT